MNHQVAQEIKVQEIVKWARAALVVVLIAAVGGGSYLLYSNYMEGKNAEAFDALFDAEKVEELAAREAATLKQELDDVMLQWTAEKKAEYTKKLEVVVAKYPGSSAAAVALLKLGRWDFLLGKYSAATETFTKLIQMSENNSKLSLYSAMALESRGASLEAEKKYDEAEKNFRKALALKENPIKPLAYLGIARNLQSLGKNEEAKKSYEELIKEFPNTEYERKARALMSRTL